jgi:hypothetical protein
VNPEVALALRDVVDRYADAVDRRDPAALRAVFSEQGVLRVQPDGGPVENEWSGTDLAEVLDTLSGFTSTFHHVGGCVFDLEGEVATGRVHCLAHHYERTGNGPVDLVMMIRYHDRYVRDADRWCIGERRVAVEWTELHPAHPKPRVRT